MVLVVDCGLENIKIRIFRKGSGYFSAVSSEMNMHECLRDKGFMAKRIKELEENERIDAVSFRILFGGDYFSGAELIDDGFFRRFRKLTGFFPLYVPHVSEILKRFADSCEGIPLIAFFETAFFNQLPDERKYYALPFEYCRNAGIRRWGFHGIFHKANTENLPAGEKAVSIVIDKQTTVCAVSGGRPFSISLGYTPLEGIMSSRSCGDVDPGIVFYLMNVHGFSMHRIDEILKSESGFLGVTGCNMELPELLKLRGRDSKIDLAFGIYLAQLMKYTGEAAAALGGLDSIVFAGSYVADAGSLVREIMKRLSFLGIHTATLPWKENGKLVKAASEESKVKVYINLKELAEIVYCYTCDFLAAPCISR
ncbi:MAG TPA: hypothetical protein PKN36_05070 [bacterium]|nr:hypothetical protein [bacterium]